MEFTEKYLENLGIYNLRNLARVLNIKSPTTKRKGQLIKEILENKDRRIGEKFVKGRPPKSNFFSEKQMELKIFEENLKKMAVELDKNFLKIEENLNNLKEKYDKSLRGYIRKFYNELNNFCKSKEETIKILSEELESLRENGF